MTTIQHRSPKHKYSSSSRCLKIAVTLVRKIRKENIEKEDKEVGT